MKKAIALTLALSASNLAQAGNCNASSAMSIADIAAADMATFSTLVTAVVKTGLLDFIDGNRNLTVFAPTNDAFDTTAKVVLEDDMATGLDLVNALDEDTLSGILRYHISPGSRDSGDVLDAARVRMLSREFTFPSLQEGVPFINDSEIVLPDVYACNGVVHVIGDEVLLPPTE